LLLPEHEQLFAYTRSLDGRTLLVLANLSSQQVAIDDLGSGGFESSELLLATHSDLLPGTLRPWESRIHLG